MRDEPVVGRADDEVRGTHRALRSAGGPARRWLGAARWGDRRIPLWMEIVALLLAALLLSLIVKSLFLQTFYVPSESMEPTLTGNAGGVQDRIVVQKVSYWGREARRGEVVVFEDPGGWLSAGEVHGSSNAAQKLLSSAGLFPSGGHLVKRVIGVGGDTVKCCDTAGRIEVNGVAIEEPYVKDVTATGRTPFSVTVPAEHLWVMGDNRGNSADSRAHVDEAGGGFVPDGNVVGKVAFVVWPWKDRSVLHDPESFASLD
ncbi:MULTISPECIES: signal peptidase I [unclassified Mumia]|uniref:signal peptidase I n=1 Tax=unclassified Mumia TaxID=2621872 RepID=UPI0021047B63|nr:MULTISPECIES: signal peptidase I [unclassified Mumia]